MNDQTAANAIAIANAAHLGQRLRTARRASGLTMEQLADLANVSIPTISTAENGTRRPRLDTLNKLATALGISMGSLLTDPPAPRTPSPPPPTIIAVPVEHPRGRPTDTGSDTGTGSESTLSAIYVPSGDVS